MRTAKHLLTAILLTGSTAIVHGQDWNGFNPGTSTTFSPVNSINDDIVTNGRVGIGTINGTNARLDAILHVVNDSLTFDPNYTTSNAISSRFGIGAILQNPSLVVVNSSDGVTAPTRIAEFRSSRRAQQDASINIRGSRDGSTTADIAAVELSNYDQNETPSHEFTLATVAAGMPINTGDFGFLRLTTSNSGTLDTRVFIDHNGNVGLGNGTTFNSAALPTRNLDVQNNARIRDLPNDLWEDEALNVVVDTDGNLHVQNLKQGSSILNCNTTNFIPRVNSSGELDCGIMQDDASNLGIGGAPQSSHTVTIYGTMQTVSDRSYKKNIQPLQNGLEKVMALRGYYYHWNSKLANASTDKQLGFISQEVREVVPEATSLSDDGSTVFMNYDAMIPVLVEAVKEQQQQIEELKEQLRMLTANGNNESLEQNASLELEKSFYGYPNPSDGIFKVNYALPSGVNNASVIITNLQGALLKENNGLSGNGEVVFDCGDLPAGIYFYSLVMEEQPVLTKKVVLKK